MPTSFAYDFDTPDFKGSVSFDTGLFINGKFVDGSEGGTIECVFLRISKQWSDMVSYSQHHQSQYASFNPECATPQGQTQLLTFLIATGEVITSVSEGTAKDVDLAVEAAQHAYDTVWGLNAPGLVRSSILWKLALLMEERATELSAIEVLNNGKSSRI